MLMVFVMILFGLFKISETRVCSSVDSRNSPDSILEYRDCTIIIGHVHIVLMELVEDPSEFLNRSFSQLVEITDYLLIYRIKGLVSLDVIFPKLEIIRGETLFSKHQYSVILYEIQDLEEIGLKKLQRINSGGIKIGSCPNLCYVSTINWEKLGVNNVVYTKPENCTNEICTRECNGNCWNTFHCQLETTNNCHQNCIGCTQPNSNAHCKVCKYYKYKGTCIETCPRLNVVNETISECLDPLECTKKSWSLWNGTCMQLCPRWYQRSSNGSCIPTKTRSCDGFQINSRFQLDEFYNCTHINGPLELVLDGYVRHSILEQALGQIEYISEYLKISRCCFLTNLNFFKGLKRIEGKKLWSNFSLFVVDNQNLNELFSSNVEIGTGEILVQNNPHLCEEKIGFPNCTKVNNGHQTNCTKKGMEITLLERNSTNVTLSWKKPKGRVIGYTIYYTIANDLSQLKDGFVEREFFASFWSSTFVTKSLVQLQKLVPYTHYAYYMKIVFGTMTTLETPVYFFETAPEDPSEPVDLLAEPQSDSAIFLTWQEPSLINGNLSYYRLALYRHKENTDFLHQRNYCLHPLQETCSCPRIEYHFFTNDVICIGTNKCIAKAMYSTRQKRSTDFDVIKDFKIESQNSVNSSFKVEGLEPFTLYTFFLNACNNHEKGINDYCGGSIMESQRTLKSRKTDVVTSVTIQVHGTNAVIIWDDPLEPNSEILAYKLEYKSKNGSRIVCIPNKDFGSCHKHYTLHSLSPNKYGLRLWVVTLASSDDYGDWHHFVVKESDTWTDFLWVAVILVVVVVCLLGLVIWKRYRKAKDNELRVLARGLSRGEVEQSEDQWKLDDETVEIIRELGQNYLGMVYKRKS